jgi:hypothetical protein
MIYESGPWKDRLLRDAKRLRELMRATRTPLRRTFAIEQAFFRSAFSMRKLWEAHKLSSSWGQRSLSCRQYKLKATVPTIFSRHDIDELYDLDAAIKGTIKAPELCNLLVHSFIFVPDFKSNGALAGVYFASDRSRRNQLIWISARDYVSLLMHTGQNYPNRGTYKVNAGGQYDVWMDEGTRLRRTSKVSKS